MFGVAFFSEEDEHLTDQWGYLLMSFGLQKQTWEIGGKRLRWANHIESASQLPKNAPTVLFSPRTAHYAPLRGVMSLDNYWHPVNAIYLFGPSHRHLEHADIDGVPCDQKVAIDTPKETDLFPSMAAALALWDRMTKGLPLG